jgi:hypothetical protein
LARINNSISEPKSNSILGILLLVLLSISTVLFSNIIAEIFNFVGKAISVNLRLELFTFAAVVYSIFQYVILRHVRNQSAHIFQHGSQIRKIYVGISVIQYFFISSTILLILQMFTISGYSFIVVTLITLVSYTSSSIILSILSIKLFYWVLRERNKIFILYAASMMILTINIISSVAYGQALLLNQRPTDIMKDRLMSDDKHIPQNRSIFYIYSNSSIASFIANFFAAIILLRSFAMKSKIFYWIMAIIPLFYFVSQYSSFLYLILAQVFVSLREVVLFYNITYTIIESLAGSLIGITFFITATKISHPKLKNNLYFCAIGYTVLFNANYIINVASPIFPPFGLLGILYVPLSTYLIFVGIYSAASIGANDNQLRKLIRKTVQESILENISRSENIAQVESQVLRATKKLSNHLEKDTGFNSSYEDEDIREYVKTVATEIDSMKK